MSDNSLIWIVLLVSLSVGECLTAKIHERLALVWAEKNVSLQDVWNNVGVDVITTNNLTITQSKQGQNLRNGIIDDWMNNMPTSVSMVFYNMQEDVLGYWNFSTTESNSSLSSWLTETRILSSSYTSVTFQNVKLQQKRTHFDMFVSDSIKLNLAWFGATSDTATMLSNAFPVFFISKSLSTAYPLQTESSTVSSLAYAGCWHFTTLTSTLAMKDAAKMTVEKCVAACSTSNKPLVLLHLKVECHCGKFINTALRDDLQCLDYCPGNNKQICGKTPGMYAVYKNEDITIKAPTIPVPVIQLHSKQVTVESSKLVVDLSSFQPEDFSPVHVTALSASAALEFILEFRLIYKIKGQWLNYTHWNGDFVTFQTEITNNLTVLPVTAIGLVFLSDLGKDLPFQLQVNVFSIGEENFIQAPVLTIEGHWLQVVQSTVQDHTTSRSSLTPGAIDETTTPGVIDETATSGVLDETTTPGVIDETTTLGVIDDTTSDAIDDTTTAANPTIVELNGFSTEASVTTAETTIISNYKTSVASVVTTDVSQNTAFTSSESTFVSNAISGTTSMNISTISSVTRNTSCISLNGSTCGCSCSCYAWFNTTISSEELAQKIKELRALLLINKKQLSSFTNKLISADDERPSAKQIGGFGAAILVTLVSLIVAGDLLNLMRSYLHV